MASNWKGAIVEKYGFGKAQGYSGESDGLVEST